MMEPDIWLVVASVPAVISALGVIWGFSKTLNKIGEMEKMVRRLNHNSSAITKALLAKGILKPEDIKDVEL